MNLHRNARLTPRGRRLLVERVCLRQVPLKAAAQAAGVSTRTACKWVARYRREGLPGLEDRSSAPHRVPRRTDERRVAAIAALRRLRMTAAEISELLEMPLSRVSAVLLRIGLGKRSRLEPLEPPNRYQRERPGELVHIDVKKLGRIKNIGHRITGNRRDQRARVIAGRKQTGWEYVQVCVEDATRLAHVEVLADEKGLTVAGVLRRAIAFYASHGIRVARHDRQRRRLPLVSARPRLPRTPTTPPPHPPPPTPHQRQSRALIRTMLGGWAYGAIYRISSERTRALPGWLDHDNRRRPHRSLNNQPPLTRLTQMRNNLPGSYT
jgi:transposase